MEKMDVSSSKAASFPCDLCDVVCTSQQIYDGHVVGARHQKKVKRQELEKLWENKDPSVYCTACQLALEPLMMETHINGTKHKSMVENGSSGIKEQKSKAKTKKPVSKDAVTEIKCTLCSVVLTNMSIANDHFNSKTHEAKCAKKYLQEKKAARVDPENTYYCDTCDLTLNGENTYHSHLQGFKHNNKLMKGNFDPNSPFAAKTLKLKAKIERVKDIRRQKKLLKAKSEKQ